MCLWDRGSQPVRKVQTHARSGVPGLRTCGQGATRAALRNDGRLVLHAGASTAIWASKNCQLGTGQALNPGENLISSDGSLELIMQTDGDLVLCRRSGNVVLWTSGTAGNPGAYVTLQGDGNLVVYRADRKALWASGTCGQGTIRAALENDGRFVLYTSDDAIVWASNVSTP